MKKLPSVLIVILVLILAVCFGIWYFYEAKVMSSKNKIPEIITPIVTSTVETTIKYTNTQFSFNFFLPLSWQGYSTVLENWQGNLIDNQSAPALSGSKIIIRHPLWTSGVPRQDIPIMVFTYSDWDLIQQEKLSLGAAPIGPNELSRNANYIFALPARYNYAFPLGFEEVDQIMQSQPLQAF